MMGSGRMTKGTAASISFGLGSFTLMADITLVVIREGENGGTIFDMGFPTPIGIAGMILWLIGIVLLISFKASGRSRPVKDSIKPLFLRGRKTIACPSCKERIDASGITYHERYTCRCGAVYDLYQEPDDS